MATAPYTKEKLRRFAEDLREIADDAERLYKTMEKQKVATIQINNDKGQKASRKTLHAFVSSGFLVLKTTVSDRDNNL